MNMYFFNLSDDKRAVNKRAYYETTQGHNANFTLHITGNLKNDTSILDPVFEVSYNATIMNANYIYVPELNRYYYINDITVGTQRLYIKCHVDVLMSYASGIGSMKAVVERQENRWNLYLQDKAFKIDTRKTMKVYEFSEPYGFSGEDLILCTGGN